MIDADKLKDRLSSSEHRRILERCGFDLQGERGDELGGILGPKALGEGEKGNFSVDLQDGRVKDWGSSGYTGDVLDVVQDTQRLGFQEALQWIAEEVGLDPDSLQNESYSNGRSSGSSTSPSAPRGDGKAEGDPEVDVPQSDRETDPEPVVDHQQVSKWHDRLMGEGEAPEAARRYLLGERGLHKGILKLADVGLAPSTEIPDGDAWSGFYRPEARRADWWIIFPVPALYGEHIASVKGVAFDPEATDWKRGSDGEKIPSNAGPVTLWDLVPTEEDGSPRIDGRVVVCEGEVDALCALSHGFNAVTGTGGAGTFKPEWAPYIADLAPAQERGVVVCYDGDDRGRRGANEEAAPKLYDAGLEPRVASLPDDTDVNDLLVEYGEDGLHAQIVQAEPYAPEDDSEEESDSAGGPTLKPLLGTEEPEPLQWRVTDFVPEEHLTMLVGDGGTGKSILALHLALCICTGRPFLKMGTRQGRVLYIDHELDRDEQLRRVHRIARAMGMDAGDTALRDRFWYWRPMHPLGSEEHQENLLEAVEERDIDLVILDSLTMGAEGDVTDVADVVPIMQHIRQWPTTIAIDHVSHSTARGSAAEARAFGSVFKRNAARSSLTLAQSETGGYALQQEKSNFSEGDGRLTYAVEWGEEEINFEPISDADERAQGLLSDLSSKDVTLVAVKEEYEALGGPVLAENVVDWRDGRDDVSSVKKKTVQNQFSALKRSGDLIGASGKGVMPKAAEYDSDEEAHDSGEEAPF